MSVPQAFLDYVTKHKEPFIERLSEAVAFKSVSGDSSLREDVNQMVQWFEDQLKAVGVQTDPRDLGWQNEEHTLKLPNAILGKIGNDPNKKTVLVYGHMDVQPAEMDDGWKTDPWTLTVEPDERMVGRGSTDDKGPICAWVNVLQAHADLGLELPVNMRFCFEAMEESGSEGLEKLIQEEAEKGDSGAFDHVDCVCITDSYWLNNRTPILTYGVRGITYFEVTVTGPHQDLHSGMWGNVVYEPMTDLVNLLSQLVRNTGNIMIDGAYDGIEQPGLDEIKEYESIDYTLDDVKEAVGGDIALCDNVTNLLMNRMRWPSLSIHGIRGGSSDMVPKTVIPARVTGKFSLRIVPPQTPEDIQDKVKSYITKVFNSLHTKSTLESIVMTAGGDAWITDDDDWNYQAADAATLDVYGRAPDHTREGGSIPITLTFSEALGAGVSILLLPIGRGDDGAHSTNEKLDVSNYMNGTKLLGTYLYKVAASPRASGGEGASKTAFTKHK